MMTIKQASKMAGISVRTLQYYDKIGLLKPAKYTDSKYRLYDEETMEKLQQILLFKELEFSLEEIKEIVTKPNFDKKKAVKQQIELLTLKRERLDKLIDFARGLNDLGGNKMDFKAFDESKLQERAKKAKQMWGEGLHWSEESRKKLIGDVNELFEKFGEVESKGPESPEAQDLVKKLQEILKGYYGKFPDLHFYNFGLLITGKSMLEDFGIDSREDLANFVYKAIKAYLGDINFNEFNEDEWDERSKKVIEILRTADKDKCDECNKKLREVFETADGDKLDENTKKAQRMYEKVLSWTDEDKKNLSEQPKKILGEFDEIKSKGPDSSEAQNLVKKLQEHHANYYGEYTNEMLYNYGRIITGKGMLEYYGMVDRDDLSDFIYQAIKIYCGK